MGFKRTYERYKKAVEKVECMGSPKLLIVQGYDSRNRVRGFHLKLEALAEDGRSERTTPEVFLYCTGINVLGKIFIVYECEGSEGRKRHLQYLEGRVASEEATEMIGLLLAHERIWEVARDYYRDWKLDVVDKTLFKGSQKIHY